jgi:hypothetical protein
MKKKTIGQGQLILINRLPGDIWFFLRLRIPRFTSCGIRDIGGISPVSSGIYFYKLETNQMSFYKIVLEKQIKDGVLL